MCIGLVYCVCLDIHNSKSILDVERKEVHHSCNPSPLFRGGVLAVFKKLVWKILPRKGMSNGGEDGENEFFYSMPSPSA